MSTTSEPTTSTTPTEQELRAFVGPDAGYYLRAWQPALSGQGGPGRFNVAAFFFSGLWLGYRKMYAVLFLLFGVLLAEKVLEEVLFVGASKGEAQIGLRLFFVLIVAIVVAVCGNGWYLSHARRVIAEVRSRGLSQDAHLKALAERGGTNLGASLGLVFLFMLVGGLVGLVLGALLGQV